MSQILTEAELELALAAQQAQLEAKVALADHEVAYQGTKAELVDRVKATTEARQHALAAILQARGLDPREWTINVATQEVEPAGAPSTGLLGGLGEVLLEQGQDRPFRPLSSEEELERGRGGAVAAVRLTRPGNGGHDDRD